MPKHEYLTKEEFYETNNVGTKARGDKQCEHCGELIPKGEPHHVHIFYPEFSAFATHSRCSAKFLASLN